MQVKRCTTQMGRERSTKETVKWKEKTKPNATAYTNKNVRPFACQPPYDGAPSEAASLECDFRSRTQFAIAHADLTECDHAAAAATDVEV